MKIISLFIVLFIVSPAFASEFYTMKQAERYAKIALKEKDIVLVGSIDPASECVKEGRITLYEFSRGESDTFYVVFTEAKGRYDFFDYVMSVNKNFEIEKIRILKYRSEHGGEIKSRKWLSQFENYTAGKEIRYKKEISALSGATLSATGLVNDVPKVLTILKDSVEK